MTYLSKHPAFNDELLPENNDLFQPKFMRDTKGTYFMQLPGYGKWKVSVEPGSKIISQGSETEDGKPATNPESIMTGSLYAETVIRVGDNIYLDAGSGCIFVGDYKTGVGPWISLCGDGLKGHSGGDVTFAFYLAQGVGDESNFAQGDVFIGDYMSDEYVWWDDSAGKLFIKGDLVIMGDIIGGSYPSGNYYWLDYSEGDIEITGELRASNVVITGGDINNIQLTGLLAGSEPSIQGWTTDVIFTATDWNTISWTAGSIFLLDGTTYTVNSGFLDMNNDNVHYIFWNNSTTLSTTTSPHNAVGSHRLLMCVAKRVPVGKDAIFQAFGTSGQNVFITADNIAANTITANEIYANTITAGQIAANTITANQIQSLYFGGKYAEFDLGVIGGWVISSQCLTKDKDVGVNGASRIQLCVGPGSGAGHLQAAYNHNRSAYPGFPHPNAPIDLVQITQGAITDPGGQPNPRVDIYRATTSNTSKKRMMLNAFGLSFYDENENLVGTITGNDSGSQTNFNINDISVANNTVRILNTGVRVANGKAFSAADGSGYYFQMSVDTAADPTFGRQGVWSMPSSNYIKIQNNASPIPGFVARFNGNPGGSYALHLAGALRLGLTTGMNRPTGQHGVVYYDDGNLDIARRGKFYGYNGYTATWTEFGGGAALPSGSDYDMLRCTSGTTWQSTADVFIGSSGSHYLYKNPSDNDIILTVPSGDNFAMLRGGTFIFKVGGNTPAEENIWTRGQILSTNGQIFLGASKELNIRWTGAQCYINKDTFVNGTIRCSGSVEMGTGRVRVGGTDFYPLPYLAGKTYLRSL